MSLRGEPGGDSVEATAAHWERVSNMHSQIEDAQMMLSQAEKIAAAMNLGHQRLAPSREDELRRRLVTAEQSINAAIKRLNQIGMDSCAECGSLLDDDDPVCPSCGHENPDV